MDRYILSTWPGGERMSYSLYRTLLNSTNYVMVSREFVKKLGATRAIVLTELIKKEDALIHLGQMSDDGSFYYMSTEMQENTSFSYDQITAHLKALKDLGVISYERRGQPPKNWFRINKDMIETLLEPVLEEDDLEEKDNLYENSEARRVWNDAHPDDKVLIGSGYVVHHKDLDHTNNALENLQKMTKTDHTILHNALRKNRSSKTGESGITTPESSGLVSDKNESIKNDSILNQNDLLRSTDAEASSPPEKKRPELKEEMKQLFLEVLPLGEFTNRPIQEGKPVSQLYLDTARFLSLLPDPKAFAHAYVFDDEWMKKEKIDLNYFEGRAIEPLVRRAVKRFALMRKVGYEPEKKSALTRYLQDFFYNPAQKKSWFLFCCFHEPVEINRANKDLGELADEDREVLLRHKQPDWSEKDYLLKAVRLLKWYRKNAEDLQVYNYYVTDATTFWQTRFSDIDSLLNVIDEYSKTWKEWTIGNFGMNNGTWEYFLKWCRDTFKVELDPSPAEVAEARKIKEREDKRSKARDAAREPEDATVAARRDQIRDELLAGLEEEA